MPLYSKQIQDYTWANKPSVAPLGQIICVTDVGENGSLWRGDGTKWIKLSGFKYYQSTTPSLLTGTTDETVMGQFTLKGTILGKNGRMKIWPVFTRGTGTSNRTVKANLNGVQCFGSLFASASSYNALIIVRNQNSESSQKTSGNFATGGLGGGSSNINTTENTANDVTVTITGTLSNAAEPLTLDGFFVEVI